MRRLPPRDLRALLRCLRDLYAPRDLTAFPHHVVAALRHPVPADVAFYDGASPTEGRTTWVVEPFDTFPGAQRVFSEYMHEHPCFLYPGRIPNGRSWRLSDFLTRSRLHRLNLYGEYYRRRGIEYQLGIRLSTGRSFVIAVGVNRGPKQRDFTDDNVLSMDLLGPHLVEAYRNAEALTEARAALEHEGEAEAGGRGVVIVRRSGVPFVSLRARQLLERYVGWPVRRSRTLPDVLALWIARQQALLGRDDEVPPPPEALVIEREDNQLRVRLLGDTGQSILLLEERVRDIGPVGLARLDLTKREAEVLAWVARGKTNDDTARILGTRPATIAKHLERIFRKLGVETRTAAAARAFEVAGVAPPLGV